MVFESSTIDGADPDTTAVGNVLAGIPEIFAAVSGALAGNAGAGGATVEASGAAIGAGAERSSPGFET
jgi:hypothetical protein